jgi:hypothetical protein
MGRSIVEHDERSKMFRAVDLVPDDAPLVSKTWRRGGPYDQGQTSTCVAQTGKGLLNTSPFSSRVDYDIRSKYSTEELYEGAQQMDEWPGESYDGTSALGLCKYLQSRALISEYRWCFGLQDVLRTLSHVGPVGIGVYWYSDMFRPTPEGIITPTGGVEGGHEVELIGVDVTHKTVIGMNSWGPNWGMKGRFKIRWNDLESLLNNDGDAIVLLK